MLLSTVCGQHCTHRTYYRLYYTYCTYYTLYCTYYTLYCTVHIVHCTVHCTVHIVNTVHSYTTYAILLVFALPVHNAVLLHFRLDANCISLAL